MTCSATQLVNMTKHDDRGQTTVKTKEKCQIDLRVVKPKSVRYVYQAASCTAKTEMATLAQCDHDDKSTKHACTRNTVTCMAETQSMQGNTVQVQHEILCRMTLRRVTVIENTAEHYAWTEIQSEVSNTYLASFLYTLFPSLCEQAVPS